MAEKIDIDGVRFKVEADLSKLEGDLKKGEGAAKKGGENLGKAAGQGFAGTLKSNTSSALNSIEGQAGTMGSKVSGVFAKIGVAAAAAFAVDKVITFFKSAVDEAEKAEKASGKVGKGAADSFKKAEADIDAAIVNIKQVIGGPLLSVVRTVTTALAQILTGVAKVGTAIAEAFNGKQPEKIVEAYQKQKKSLIDLGDELDKLSKNTKRSAEEEVRFLELKDKLNEELKKLGISYQDAAKGATSYGDATRYAANVEKRRAQQTLLDQAQAVTQSPRALEDFENRMELERLKRSGNGLSDRARYLAREQAEYKKEQEQRARLAKELRDKAANIDAEIKKGEKAQTDAGGGRSDSFQEQRFIDSRLRLVTIEENRAYTIKKAYADKLSKEETERRIFMANEEARQATEYELGSLRSGYAQFIEDTHMAKLEAIQAEADNAKRLSYNLLEAELAQAWGNEEELQELKEQNAQRIAEIEEAAAEKQQELNLESFARTMNAANATTSGLASIANARNAGGAIGGAGGVLSGVSGFSDKLKGLGFIGSGISAVGGLIGTLTDLFGKSDAERAREAEEQKRRDEEAKKIMELQAGYQRRQLELAEANAKLPFENLARKLRLTDIEAGKQRLAGVDEATITTNRLASRSALINEVLTAQAGTISGGQLFGGQGASADALTTFLSERAAQAVAVTQFTQLMESINGGGSYGQYDETARQLATYKGKIPDKLFALAVPIIDAMTAARSALGDGTFESHIQASAAAVYTGKTIGAVRALSSEIGSDTAIAENLLSVIEQQQQTDLEIAQNTKKTAENTTKLVETPQRQSSIIDISRGYTRSLGQILNPGITNTGLPSSIQAAVLATDIQKSIQERSLDKLQNIENIQRDSRELLAIIAKGVNTNASGSLLAELESLYRRSIAA